MKEPSGIVEGMICLDITVRQIQRELQIYIQITNVCVRIFLSKANDNVKQGTDPLNSYYVARKQGGGHETHAN